MISSTGFLEVHNFLRQEKLLRVFLLPVQHLIFATDEGSGALLK